MLATAAAAVVLAAAPVPAHGIVAADLHGRLLVLDAGGATVRRVPGVAGLAVQGIAVAPDRRHAYVSVYGADAPARLYRVDLENGRRRLIAPGLSPSLSPDRTRLAYLASERRGDITYVTALVVLDLRTGATRRLPFDGDIAQGTPPELVFGWSPDARRIALYDGRRVRIADTRSTAPISSQPAIRLSGLAPIFLDARRLVLLANCCIGRQRLVAVDVKTSTGSPFAGISSPDETAQRLRDGTLLVTTALHELVVVTRGRARVLAHGITAAAA